MFSFLELTNSLVSSGLLSAKEAEGERKINTIYFLK